MAIFKKIAASGKYQDDQAIPDLITYITSPAKTPRNFIDGIGVNGEDIAGSMVAVSETFGKNSKIRLHILSYHSIPGRLSLWGIWFVLLKVSAPRLEKSIRLSTHFTKIRIILICISFLMQ